MKIKYLIDTILSPKIQPLDFVDRYAGIVRTINIAEGNGTETGIIKRYPLACDVTGVDCANVGVYQNLVPDDTKKSVIYWEMISPMSNTGYTKTKDFYRKKFKGTARLVVWLNLAKLGITNCTDSILVLPILEKEITTRGKILSGIYEGDLLWIEPLRMVNQDINTIFGKYDYNKLKNYYLYPFDFFAIDVQFTLEQCLSKGGTFPILPAADCVNGATIPETCRSLIFDGVNEYINTPPAAGIFDRFDPFTFSMWVKPQFKSFPMLFSKYLSGTGYRLFINSSAGNTLQFEMEAAGEVSIRTVSAVTFNQWQLLTVSNDGIGAANGVKIYLNGNELTKNILSDNLTSSILTAKPLEIGAETNQPLYYSGNIASFRAWKVELTPTQILGEYNGGTIKTDPVQNTNLVINTDINKATFISQWSIPDLTGITAGYTSVNMEIEDRVEDCPE